MLYLPMDAKGIGTQGKYMNGVDYSKQLAKDREYYQDALQKANKSHDKRLTDTNERNEHVQTKQRDNFIEDKAELESNYQKNVNQLKEKTEASLSNSSNQFAKDVEKEREQFTRTSQMKSKDFDQRLNDIKSSYDKSFKAEREGTKNIQDGQKKRYERNVGELRNKVDTKLAENQDQTYKTISDVNDTAKRERRDLVRGQEDNLSNLQNDELKKRADLKTNLQSTYEKSSAIQKQDADNMRNYLEEKNNNVKETYKNQFTDLAEDYGHHTNKVVSKQQAEAKKADLEGKQQLTEVRRDFNKKLHEAEMTKRRNDPGTGEYAEVMGRQKGLQDEEILDRKIDDLKGRMSESQRFYQARAEKDQNMFNETLHSQKNDDLMRSERKLGEANADRLITVANERENAQKELGIRENLHTIDKISFENTMMLERSNSSDRVGKLKENFNKSMQSLDEKHKAAIKDVTIVANQDKSDFVRKTNEARTKEIFEMKREFGKLMDTTVQDYEQRLAKFQRENEFLKLNMSQKVQNIVDQTDKQLESQRVLFENRRVADVKAQQMMMDQSQSKSKADINQMSLNFQKKMDKIQVDSETKLKLLTNDYENKLKEVQASKVKEIGEKDLSSQMELQRMKKAFEDEKAGLIKNYEEQLATIKATHKEKVSQMNDFKKMS